MTIRHVKTALISVSDKTGLIGFAAGLARLGIRLISTGGTAQTLHEAGLPVQDVSEVTGFPEILDGRVKTLHPLVHGGILGRRDLETHRLQMAEHHIDPIDLVVVNLYPFRQTVSRADVTPAEAIEKIDIGGPTMVRAAAKNFRDVAVVTAPESYSAILEELQANAGGLTLETRFKLARAAFEHTAGYDAAIAEFLANRMAFDAEGGDFTVSGDEEFPAKLSLRLTRKQALRYGENPHQGAALYRFEGVSGVGTADAEQLQGKELSYNNLIDLDAAWNLAREFDHPACAIIKHTNPSGVGVAAVPLEAYRLALATDPVSAFGGIIAFNRKVDAGTATDVMQLFVEAVVAPDYDEAALEVFARKKNVRVMRVRRDEDKAGHAVRSISGGLLLQTADTLRVKPDDLRVVSKRQPTERELSDLLFAWTICKHVKSNAVVYAREHQLVGVGAGQMSRVDSVRIGAMKANLPLEGCVLASDAFFPFRDGIDTAAEHNITAVIQPGGSVRDAEVIQAADEHGLAMVFTGFRHFKH